MISRSVVMPTLPGDLQLAEGKREELLGGFEVIIETAPGLAYATRLGVEAAAGEVVVVMDCDELHPAYLAGILANVLERDGLDLVKASRAIYSKGPRGQLSLWGNRLIRRVLELQVADCTTCFYAARRDKLLELPHAVWHGHGDYMMDLLHEAKLEGWKVGEYQFIAPEDHRDGSTSMRKHVPMYLRRTREVKRRER